MERKWFYCEQCNDYKDYARVFSGPNNFVEYSCLTCGHLAILKEKPCDHDWVVNLSMLPNHVSRTCEYCGKLETGGVVFEWPK